MREIAQLLNEMIDAGVITDYALFGALTPDAVAALASRHGLQNAWKRFRSRFLDD
ncbi:MAG: hypothetical protein ACREAA_04630 [Candidatus Polarisedimenticolia bacterium]